MNFMRKIEGDEEKEKNREGKKTEEEVWCR